MLRSIKLFTWSYVALNTQVNFVSDTLVGQVVLASHGQSKIAASDNFVMMLDNHVIDISIQKHGENCC